MDYVTTSGKTITAKHIDMIWRNLKQFGYTDLTRDIVESGVEELAKGEKTTNGIIGMMSKSMLEEAKLI